MATDEPDRESGKGDNKDGGHWIFRAWITRDGERVYASEYGLRAWPIWVDGPSKSDDELAA